MIRWEDQIHYLRDYVVLFLLLFISLVLLNSNSNPQIRWLHAVSIGFIGTIQKSLSFYEKYARLEHENEYLRDRLARLSYENSLMKEAYLNNIRLKKMLGFKKRARARLIAARVAGRNYVGFSHAVLIDVGQDEGLREKLPVVTDAGLVGKVVLVAPHTSVVQLINDMNFRASAMTQRSRVVGIFAPAGAGRFYLNDVPAQADVKPGDVVITSGYSENFPKGIRIGLVTRVAAKKNSLLKTIEIKPSVKPQDVENVFVIMKKQTQ